MLAEIRESRDLRPLYTPYVPACVRRAVRVLAEGLSDKAMEQPQPLQAAAEAACAALAAHLPAQECAGLAIRLLQRPEALSVSCTDLGLSLAQSAVKRVDHLSGEHFLPGHTACNSCCRIAGQVTPHGAATGHAAASVIRALAALLGTSAARGNRQPAAVEACLAQALAGDGASCYSPAAW